MSKSVLVFLANGFEEIEAVTVIDVLLRAGLAVRTVGVEGAEAVGSHGLKLKTDLAIGAVRDLPDAVILPGGMPGSDALGASAAVRELTLKVHAAGGLVAAICAAPARALAKFGVLAGKRATCFPGFEADLGPNVKFVTDRVVVDGNVVTSRAAGTAMEFSLTLAGLLTSQATAAELKQRMLA